MKEKVEAEILDKVSEVSQKSKRKKVKTPEKMIKQKVEGEIHDDMSHKSKRKKIKASDKIIKEQVEAFIDETVS